MKINRNAGLALTGCAAALALAASVPGTSADAASLPLAASGTYYQLTNNHSHMCAGVSGRKTSGAPVVIEGCTGNPDREWRKVQFNRHVGAWSSIQNKYSGLCLGAPGDWAAARLAEYRCTSSPSQLWAVVPYTGGGTMVNEQSGMCLSVDAAKTAPGTAVTEFYCGNYVDQTWH